MFSYENDDFPSVTDEISKVFANERALEKMLLDQGSYFWRQFGVNRPEKNGGQTPDLITTVRGYKRKIQFGIEVEWRAANFIRHKHDPFNIHLIICAWAPLGVHQIRSIPVVAMYRKMPDRMYQWSLENDCAVVFHDQQDELIAAQGWCCDDD